MVTIIKRTLPSRLATIAFGHDVFMAAVSFGLSMGLRVGFDFAPTQAAVLLPGTVVFTAISALVFLSLRLYRGIWRYASMNDLLQLARAVSIIIIVFSLLMFLLVRLEGIPRSLPFINWFVLLALLGGPRFIYRLYKDRSLDWKQGQQAGNLIPVLLLGAGDEAEIFIRASRANSGSNYYPVGILSETNGRVGREMHGVRVLGTIDNLKEAIRGLNAKGIHPQRLVLTKDTIKGAEVSELLKDAEALGLTLARTSRVHDLKSGASDEIKTRPIAIEDLLGRPQQPLNRAAMAKLVGGKRVLVTGAGGSIGSELVRQILGLDPAKMLLLENSEYALYKIDREVSLTHPDVTRSAVIADVRDRDRVEQVFQNYKPELVFHAAALKHVPLVEENPFEGVMTNIIGTRNVADACVNAGAEVMVMISTDKAVNPTNIMGATKRAAECYCQALDVKRGNDDGTQFITVRFGNVLGSTGSVVPLFTKQIDNGGPITVTHPDMTRYFMTTREAVELVLQASSIGVDSHEMDGKIFVLDMGKPVKIVDMATQMIRLAGLEPGKDIKIEFTGIRPGEKLFEEIFHVGEPPVATSSPGILLAAPRVLEMGEVNNGLDSFYTAAKDENMNSLKKAIFLLVPEYSPDSVSEKK